MPPPERNAMSPSFNTREELGESVRLAAERPVIAVRAQSRAILDGQIPTSRWRSSL